MVSHDVFTCECHETCSACLDPVLDSTLTETDQGRVCRGCLAEIDEAYRAIGGSR